MTQRASEPATVPEMYAVGEKCTWHGFLDRTVTLDVRTGESELPNLVPCCPVCGQSVRAISLEKWIAQTKGSDPGLLRWSLGKCFPDYDTLIDAYRQAMEE